MNKKIKNFFTDFFDLFRRANKNSIDENFLYQSYRLYEVFNPRVMLSLSVTLILFLVGILCWSYVTPINKVVSANGKIVPSDKILTVQHFDGGLIHKILIHDGQHVKKGQILFILDGAGSQQERSKNKERLLHLKLRKHRYDALLNKRAPNFERFTNNKKLIQEQMDLYRRQKLANEEELNVLKKQLYQQQLNLEGYKTALETSKEKIKISKEMIAMYKTLSKGGHSSRMKYLEEQQKLIKVRENHNTLLSDIKKAEQTIKEHQDRISSFSAKFDESLSSTSEQLNMDIQTVNQTLSKLSDRVKRLTIKTPVTGVIKEVKVKSVGDVVRPGQSLAEIVPKTRLFQANINIDPIDIGQLKIGQDAIIKITAFDFVQYGIIKGKLIQLSASTFENSNGKVFYRGVVKMNAMYIGNQKNGRQVIPGMRLKAELITGQQTVFQYLLKPVYRAFQGGLNEY